MNAILFDLALTAYILAAVATVGSFADRRDQLARFTLLLTQAGWAGLKLPGAVPAALVLVGGFILRYVSVMANA